MLDRTIPFFNAILRCDEYEFQPVLLPNGYQIVSYQPGFEKDWARLEYEIGDFDSEEEAEAYFNEQYLHKGWNDDILFLKDKSGMVIRSCITWTDKRQDLPVHSLHWLIVNENN